MAQQVLGRQQQTTGVRSHWERICCPCDSVQLLSPALSCAASCVRGWAQAVRWLICQCSIRLIIIIIYCRLSIAV